MTLLIMGWKMFKKVKALSAENNTLKEEREKLFSDGIKLCEIIRNQAEEIAELKRRYGPVISENEEKAQRMQKSIDELLAWQGETCEDKN